VSYDSAFYDAIAPGCRSSAEVVVPLILEVHPAASVVDVGCGQGWWGAEFAKHGCEVIGIDGGYVPDRQIGDFVERDLTASLPRINWYDLAVCLEVAEHLPESRAAGFVEDLCSLAPVVVFSAAVPHQTGAGHVNCQWPSWWAALFAEQGYGVDGSLRWQIWADDRVEPWYRQNILIASRDATPSEPLDVIHPVIHGWGR
jgi:SAM-dependent methyltransferase